MPTQLDPETPPIDYAAAEGLDTEPAHLLPPDAEADRRAWIYVGLGLVGLVALIAVLVSIVALATGSREPQAVAAAPAAAHTGHAATATTAAPTADDAEGVKFEPFEKVDPTLPPGPAGAVKKFKVDVFQHVTQVSKDLAPTEVWSFAVNGTYHRGTGVSAPMVVNEGDTVDFTLEEEGGYPFVTHAFGDMVKGALGVLKTPNAPEGGGGHDMAAHDK